MKIINRENGEINEIGKNDFGNKKKDKKSKMDKRIVDSVESLKNASMEVFSKFLTDGEFSDKILNEFDNFATYGSNLKLSVFAVSENPVFCLNSEGQPYVIKNIVPRDQKDGKSLRIGLHVLTTGADINPIKKNELNPRAEQILYPLPKKGEPVFLTDMGFVAFYDEADRDNFIRVNKGKSLRSLILDYAFGECNILPGLSNTIFLLSRGDVDYYTLCDDKIFKIPKVHYEECYYNFPNEMQEDVKAARERGSDILVNVTKVSYKSCLHSDDDFEISKEKHPYFIYNWVEITSEMRENDSHFFLSSLNLLIFKTALDAEKAIKCGLSSDIEKTTLTHAYNFVKQEFEERYRKDAEKSDKKLMHFLLKVLPSVFITHIFDRYKDRVLEYFKNIFLKETGKKAFSFALNFIPVEKFVPSNVNFIVKCAISTIKIGLNISKIYKNFKENNSFSNKLFNMI